MKRRGQGGTRRVGAGRDGAGAPRPAGCGPAGGAGRPAGPAEGKAARAAREGDVVRSG